MSRRARGLLAAIVTATAAVVIVVGLLQDEGRERDRAERLASRLRCPVCTSESIADSPSETARALRRLIDEQVAQGRTDQEIEDFFVARYGEWVLLDPGPRGVTLALWVLPMLALVVGVFAILARRRRLPRRELTEDERRRVAEAIRRLGRTEEDE